MTSLLVLDDTVYSANVGDSRAVLCRKSGTDPEPGKLTIVGLSKDHSPSSVRLSPLSGFSKNQINNSSGKAKTF